MPNSSRTRIHVSLGRVCLTAVSLMVFGGCAKDDGAENEGAPPGISFTHSEVVALGEHPSLRPKKRVSKENAFPQVDMAVAPDGYERLPAETRELIDQGFDIEGGPKWSGVLLHSSGEESGSAASLRFHHERVLKLEGGMAYHFVIGNGKGAGDGEIQTGGRWLAGFRGGGVRDSGRAAWIEICLIGEGNEEPPTVAQLEALRELLTKIESRIGELSSSKVLAHDEVEFNRRACPGRHFPMKAVKSRHASD